MSLLDDTDKVTISGGVPADAPFVQEARKRGIPITNDSQEFIRRSPTAVIGITGSAGKTTTTALTGVMSQIAGRRTWVGGNIGQPLIADLDKMAPDDVVVQELSSFQLEVWTQSPHIATVLNITPNHLDRHKTMEAYTDAKANIFKYQTADDIAVLCADDAGSMGLRPLIQGHLRTFSMQDEVADGAFLRDEQIVLRNGSEKVICSVGEVKLRGRHNLLNVLAAVTLADSAGIATDAMRQAIRTFKGVEHRLELVRSFHGVQYVNDSIATAPERALAALDAFSSPIVLLAGGQDKDMAWDNWAEIVPQKVKEVILFGELADLLAEKLGDFAQVQRVATMADAVALAQDTAVYGDVVLLSPGGTSFDAFNNFAERGVEFRNIVNEM